LAAPLVAEPLAAAPVDRLAGCDAMGGANAALERELAEAREALAAAAAREREAARVRAELERARREAARAAEERDALAAELARVRETQVAPLSETLRGTARSLRESLEANERQAGKAAAREASWPRGVTGRARRRGGWPRPRRAPTRPRPKPSTWAARWRS
jgi:hypothetical protein